MPASCQVSPAVVREGEGGAGGHPPSRVAHPIPLFVGPAYFRSVLLSTSCLVTSCMVASGLRGPSRFAPFCTATKLRKPEKSRVSGTYLRQEPNGIQEVEGSTPFGSTCVFKDLADSQPAPNILLLRAHVCHRVRRSSSFVASRIVFTTGEISVVSWRILVVTAHTR